MREQLLQFIWLHQYFNVRDLQTSDGEPLRILSPGRLNQHQGPDFLDAGIRIGHTMWAGNIELHVSAADWNRHAHEKDKLYRNVILHVVWAEPHPEDRIPAHIPLLVLQHRVPKLLLSKYEEWMTDTAFIACERQLPQVEGPIWIPWKKQLLEQRLRLSCHMIETALKETHQHWDAVTWWRMARSFGLPVNTMAFEAVARSLPITLLARYINHRQELEALLLGQAGLLEGSFREDHPRSLQTLFRHLYHKHQLSPTYTPVLFLRMRPGNFPTIRLSQLAGLLAKTHSWFTLAKEATTPLQLKKALSIEASTWWTAHYTWEKSAPEKTKRLGEAMINSLLINAFIPLLYAYGVLRNEKAFRDKAFSWLEDLRAEKNTQVAGWANLGIHSSNAADSQALLHLKKRYCDTKDCLQCAIGRNILAKTL